MFDFHTHNPDATQALISVEPGFSPRPDAIYSVGIHPWHSENALSDDNLKQLKSDASLACVKAIGETGLDRLRGAPLEKQTELLTRHIELSEQLGKPLVLHIVKAFSEIISLKHRSKPTQPWIIHGFRGKPQLALQLLEAGFYLSLGQRRNDESLKVIPSSRLLVETDESLLPIADIAKGMLQLDPDLGPRLLKL